METVKVLHAWASGWHSSQRHRSLGVCQHPLTALDVVPEHCCHVDVASCSVMVRQSHESIWGEGVPICLAKGAGYSQTQQCSSLPLSRHRAVLLLLFLCLNFLFFFFFYLCLFSSLFFWTEKLVQRPLFAFNLFTESLHFSMWCVRCSGCLGFKQNL